ncbi:hypothetical protein [Loktanella sp. 3ANDIMAR09]|uniref:hypothetical protein n=1 Tax=Loktanella sp. 3ANDIMAR09 TaxID=1225657 RepID=UPI0012ED871F|nr:hypothetical protein [Loktanella sp. 3ANDIMAR09]
MILPNSIVFSDVITGDGNSGLIWAEDALNIALVNLSDSMSAQLSLIIKNLGHAQVTIGREKFIEIDSALSFEIDIVLVLNGNESDLIEAHIMCQALQAITNARIVLVSSRTLPSGSSAAFLNVCDAIIGFPFNEEKLKYLLRRLSKGKVKKKHETL